MTMSEKYRDAMVYFEEQNKEEWERDRPKGWWGCAERPVTNLEKLEADFYRGGSQTDAVKAAIAAVQTYIDKEKYVNNLITQTKNLNLAEKFGYSEKQLDLVKRTVAKNATDDELELFFYRCKELELNPLMPGQVYFLKFGTAPGTVIIGLDGFRIRAHRTGQLSGIKRGVIRNEEGECIGGWADVYRKDWSHPAHEEVTLSEYMDPRKQTWKSMPETMIKKVAEVAALRMAFPDHLGGLYLSEEMDKKTREVESEPESIKPSRDQMVQLYALAKTANIQSKIELNEMTVKEFGHPIADLSLDEFDRLCQKLTDMAYKLVAENTPFVEDPRLVK